MDSESPPPVPDITAIGSASSSGIHLSAATACGVPAGMRNNEVRSVMLYGIPIVALVMDSQERLCLAQISNTLLKNFSYNEIHNRRVALGITCVQCTPVQLELLRRAGAMPVSSRRCGMITKREAERLCKSFLAETAPPKLPDNFAFDVYHHCAWGCRGNFTPSRYNSSRAKCIKCSYCGLFFSPNKFIFHSHRLPDSKYVQPDAANFNSWRRHIKLSGTPPDDVSFAWEDVKAMFNGGSRKRAMAASLHSISKQQQNHTHRMNSSHHHQREAEFIAKRPRLSSSSPETPHSLTPSSLTMDTPPPKPTTNSVPPPYFPLVPLPSKGYPMPGPSTSFGGAPGMSQSNPGKGPLSAQPPPDFRQSFAEFMWAGKQPGLQIPYSCLLWPRPPTAAALAGLSAAEAGRHKLPPFSMGETTSGEGGGGGSIMFPHHHQPEKHLWGPSSETAAETSSAGINRSNGSGSGHVESSGHHVSAFRPVSKFVATGSGKLSSSATPLSSSEGDNLLPESMSNSSPGPSTQSVQSDDNDPDVDVIGGEDDVDPLEPRSNSGGHPIDVGLKRTGAENSERKEREKLVGSYRESVSLSLLSQQEHRPVEKNLTRLPDEVVFAPFSLREEPIKSQSVNTATSSTAISAALDLRNLSALSKDELHRVLMKESEARHRTEQEFDLMRESLEEQVRKEIAYREEVAKQLQLVRDALCQELDKERKTRFGVQQKLRGALNPCPHLPAHLRLQQPPHL